MAMPFSMSPIGSFFRWWGRELQGLAPGPASADLKTAMPDFIVSLDGDTFQILEFAKGKSLPPQSRTLLSAGDLLQYLTELPRSKRPARMWLRLPHSACFIRHVELPAAAAPNIVKLLILDLERNTPFLPADIRTAHLVAPGSARPGQIGITHLIIKRAPVDDLIEKIDRLGFDVERVDCWDIDRTGALPVDFLASDDPQLQPTRGARALVLALAVAILGLAGMTTYALIDKHETALREIRARTAQLKAKSRADQEALAKARERGAEFARLRRARQDHVSMAQTLDELTRLLPDTAWVNDLRLDGPILDFTGLATSAAGVVRAIESSTTFVDATMTQPLTFDRAEGKERFSLRARLRNVASGESSKTAEPRE